MPVKMNREDRECPKCKNSTIFNVDGEKFFCGKCLTEFNLDMTIKSEMTVEPEINEIVQETPESVKEIEIQKAEPEKQETDTITDPQLMIENSNEKL